ncbi:MAG: hypothetical protein K1Y36_25265 [Blastocatellia bacterium]|nr:hypothetical protein [Blastocatellia bacterium]
MDRVKALLRCEWTDYRRRLLRPGNPGAGYQGLIVLVAVLGFMKYLRFLGSTTIAVEHGQMLQYGWLWTGLFVTWLHPLWNDVRTERFRRRLFQPLSRQEMFLVKLGTLLMPPSAWVVIIGSLAAFYPLVAVPHPVAGGVAVSFWLVAAFLTGVTLAQWLQTTWGRRLLFTGLAVTGTAGAIYWLKNGNLFAFASGWLANLPGKLVVEAAASRHPWWAVAKLTGWGLVAYGLAFWSFGFSLKTQTRRRSKQSRAFGWFQRMGRLGGLVAKEFRYFYRLADTYLGLLAAGLATLLLTVLKTPAPKLLQIAILIVFYLNANVAFNSFGLDRKPGLARYRLAPVSGKAILLAKNLGFVSVTGIQVTPLLFVAVLRQGLAGFSWGLLEALVLALAFLALGNWKSVARPYPLHFFRFAADPFIIEAIGGLFVASLPGILLMAVFHFDQSVIGWKVPALLAVCGTGYWGSLIGCGRLFEKKLKTAGFFH